MNKRIYLFSSLLILGLWISNSAKAETSTKREGPFPYQNAAGQRIQRWLLTEDYGPSRSFFLVVDEFVDSRGAGNAQVAPIPQVTVHREFVPHGNAQHLAELQDFYSHLKDLTKGAEVAEISGATHAAFEVHPMAAQPMIGRPLWVPTHDWTRADENDYSDWFAKQVDANFFTGSVTQADCADVAMTFRWVYARDHKLPMANTLSGSQQLFGHFSSNAAWDKLPEDPDWKKDRRFQAALSYVLNNTYTHSLWGDLYPVQIDTGHVRPGTVYLFLRSDDGHTQTVKSIGADPDNCGSGECIVTYWGNEPSSQEIFISSLIQPDVYNGIGNVHSGFLMWRWPRLNQQNNWELTPASQMADYSTIQYNPPIAATTDNDVRTQEYWIWLEAQVGMKQQSQLDSLNMNLITFQQHLARRLQVTTLAQAYCVFQTCPAGSDDESNYSTPHGDSEMLTLSDTIAKTYAAMDVKDPNLQSLIQNFSQTPILFGQPNTYAVWNLALNTNGILKTFSSSASASFADRWGLPANGGAVDLQAQLIANEIQELVLYRNNQIYQALNACYNNSNAPTTLTCDPKSQAIIALNTKAIDGLVLNLQSQMVRLDASVTAATRTAIQGDLGQTMYTDNDTSIYDEVLGSNAGFVQRWSSDPTASETARWGH